MHQINAVADITQSVKTLRMYDPGICQRNAQKETGCERESKRVVSLWIFGSASVYKYAERND